ncbi:MULTISPECIES: hypothetical protein [unclassified Pseudomonas]|uniref:hypothetical protein n=1 Tax=unclassified Pseudomonas TaxID=196821 RepID=UPI0009DA6146|nr:MULTISPECIES: hypothetical protein [unclassified Pseudomonas]MBD9514383.1 hypothetical protein [Pseudomonas sp. PDM22]MBD9633727.1 hypothetical protein [Pseudomonas sp. PDM19]OQR27492.1 hypothetical protein BWR15_29940 [Pseudomonas sp. T]
MKLLLIPVLFLAGCASTAPVPVEVRLPVPVPCQVPVVEPPRFATADLRPADDLQTKVRALLAERQQHLAYETRLRAALDACR